MHTDGADDGADIRLSVAVLCWGAFHKRGGMRASSQVQTQIAQVQRLQISRFSFDVHIAWFGFCGSNVAQW